MASQLDHGNRSPPSRRGRLRYETDPVGDHWRSNQWRTALGDPISHRPAVGPGRRAGQPLGLLEALVLEDCLFLTSTTHRFCPTPVTRVASDRWQGAVYLGVRL